MRFRYAAREIPRPLVKAARFGMTPGRAMGFKFKDLLVLTLKCLLPP